MSSNRSSLSFRNTINNNNNNNNYCVYIIKFRTNENQIKYKIGQTTQLNRRINRHRRKLPNIRRIIKWTVLYNNLSEEEACMLELYETLKYISDKGLSNVLGSKYDRNGQHNFTSVTNQAHRDVAVLLNRCYRCHQHGHFAYQCRNIRNMEFFRDNGVENYSIPDFKPLITDYNDSIKISYKQNLNRINTRSFSRYNIYKDANTIGEFFSLGGTKNDLKWDYQRNFFEFV